MNEIALLSRLVFGVVFNNHFTTNKKWLGPQNNESLRERKIKTTIAKLIEKPFFSFVGKYFFPINKGQMGFEFERKFLLLLFLLF